MPTPSERKRKSWRSKYMTLETWYEFKANDWSHLVADVRWIKWLVGGIALALIAAAIAILATG